MMHDLDSDKRSKETAPREASMSFVGEWKLRNGLKAVVSGKSISKLAFGGYYVKPIDMMNDPAGNPIPFRYYHEWDEKTGNSLTDSDYDLITRRIGEEQW